MPREQVAPDLNKKIVITGAAGLVGLNLALLLREAGYTNVVGIDKKSANLQHFRELLPDYRAVNAGLESPGVWNHEFNNAEIAILLHAQIGGTDYQPFYENNVIATENVLEACKQGSASFLILISSSVVGSIAEDFYSTSKRKQETLVRKSGIPHLVLRPTLMFGWFDRKHLGWLSRFMGRSPVFPLPGLGRYIRQPLYVRDFCRVILSCVRAPENGLVFDVSGVEKINYVDLIRSVKRASMRKTLILPIPYRVFWALLKLYALFDRNPPFTTQQLEALVVPEEFPVAPWPERFGVAPTPFQDAVEETFGHPVYSKVVLDF